MFMHKHASPDVSPQKKLIAAAHCTAFNIKAQVQFVLSVCCCDSLFTYQLQCL